MGILSPEFRYAMKRHRGLRIRTKERLVGKHKRRKEKFARTIRKHLGETLGAVMVVATLATGFSADTDPDKHKTEKPTAGEINSASIEKNTDRFYPPTLENPESPDQVT